MKGKYMRRSTKNVGHPVKWVREACGMSQAKFAAKLGFSEQHLKNIEGGKAGKTISRDLQNRIYILTGAWIEDERTPPWALLEDGYHEPFSAKHYEEHKKISAGPGIPSSHIKMLLKSLDFAVARAEDKARREGDRLQFETLFFGIYKSVRALIEGYGVKEEIVKHIPRLEESPIREQRMLAWWLKDLTKTRRSRNK